MLNGLNTVKHVQKTLMCVEDLIYMLVFFQEGMNYQTSHSTSNGAGYHLNSQSTQWQRLMDCQK